MGLRCGIFSPDKYCDDQAVFQYFDWLGSIDSGVGRLRRAAPSYKNLLLIRARKRLERRSTTLLLFRASAGCLTQLNSRAESLSCGQMSVARLVWASPCVTSMFLCTHHSPLSLKLRLASYWCQAHAVDDAMVLPIHDQPHFFGRSPGNARRNEV